MKVKLDENITPRAATRLRSLGHDVDTALDEALGGHCDEAVWREAQETGRFLVTQDLDFSDVRRFKPGTHRGILLVRIPDATQNRLADYLEAWFGALDCGSWDGCFVVATPNKVRVLRPG
jgi:predicted nuclease of predicted toxin-antitoxin system